MKCNPSKSSRKLQEGQPIFCCISSCFVQRLKEIIAAMRFFLALVRFKIQFTNVCESRLSSLSISLTHARTRPPDILRSWSLISLSWRVLWHGKGKLLFLSLHLYRHQQGSSRSSELVVGVGGRQQGEQRRVAVGVHGVGGRAGREHEIEWRCHVALPDNSCSHTCM